MIMKVEEVLDMQRPSLTDKDRILTIGMWEVNIVKLPAKGFVGGDHNVLSGQYLRLNVTMANPLIHLESKQ